jgi:hypothetical protein
MNKSMNQQQKIMSIFYYYFLYFYKKVAGRYTPSILNVVLGTSKFKVHLNKKVAYLFTTPRYFFVITIA